MSSAINVKVKHNGKVHDVALDTSQPAAAFKQAIYEKTGVPLDRQKVMIKGGMLKDETDLSKIGARPGQMFMVIGTAGELPKAPTGPVTFLEDMTDAQLARATNVKVGLINLGNTCYLNSTLQVLRAIPELQVALNSFQGSLGSADGDANLTAAMRDLYANMGEASEAFPPLALLSILRQVAPQFAEMTSGAGGRGYAQQDAEEAWVRLVTALDATLKGLSAPSADGQALTSTGSSSAAANFVQQYMTGRMSIKRSSSEAPTEEPTFSSETFRVLQCNISSATNEMMSGIQDSLNQQIEKNSSSLGRLAVYDEQQRIDRLPAYLTVHFVRFYWRRDIGKKTKIMRKVKFPFDLDVTPFLSDDLKAKVLPAKNKIQAISKERDERAKIRRKVKQRKEESIAEARRNGDASATIGTASIDAPRPADDMAVDTTSEAQTANTNGPQLGAALSEEEEVQVREKESKEAQDAIDQSLRNDVGCNSSGLYELVGIVTHKGAAADAGHYLSWVRKDDEKKTDAGGKTGQITDAPTPDQEEWYQFNDEKVSVVPRSKIASLDGGGEDSVAYLLLYRSKTID